jgi:Tol biopolymer transport system component
MFAFSPANAPVAQRTVRMAGLFLLVGIACTDSVGLDDGTDGPSAQILFVSDRTGQFSDSGQPLFDIFRVDAEGVELENLTNEPAVTYRDLRLSPDGMRIAFESDRTGCYNIWVMDLEELGTVQLTGQQPGERCNKMPRWSKDGSRIAFTSSREPIERSWESYVMNADGTEPHNVSDDGGVGEGNVDWPHSWLDDGRLVFHSQRVGPPRAYLVDAEGTNLEPILQSQAGYALFWSPDGSKAAFMSEQDGNQEIYVMNSDGTGVLNLTQNPSRDTFYNHCCGNLAIDPWSPDGALIAFVSERDGNPEVYVVHADGSGLTNLTENPGTERLDGWSPDGKWIAFESDRSGTWQIFVVSPDKAELRQITDGSGNAWNAIWVSSRE